jgi:hypothetical protein
MQLSCESSGLLSRAGPGIAPCSIHRPRSATLNSHFDLPPPHAVRRIGGPLKHFSPFWRDILGCTQYALEAVEGFCPHFTSLPPLALPGPQFCTPSQGKNNCFIDQEVDALLSKGAIEEVPLFPSPFCYISPIFLVLKKSGGMRLILNLKKLNVAHLNTPSAWRLSATPSGQGIGRHP